MGFCFPQFVGSDFALRQGKTSAERPRAELRGPAGDLADRQLNSDMREMPLGLSV